MYRNYFEGESHVKTYNKFRPCPPRKLIEDIVHFTSEKLSGPLELVVDIGCGSGQSTEVFAPFSKRVVGVDSSPSIIEEARLECRHQNVSYSIGSAENVPVPDKSANLVSACQALHWFDVMKFYEEANRILCNNGVLAVYGYNLPVPVVPNAEKDLSTIVRKYYLDVLGHFVLPESKMAYLECYTSDKFNEVPFVYDGKMIRKEGYVSEVEGTLTDLTGYMCSWSTYQNYEKHMGKEKAEAIIKTFEDEFKSLLHESANACNPFKIEYNYFLLLGRKNGK